MCSCHGGWGGALRSRWKGQLGLGSERKSNTLENCKSFGRKSWVYRTDNKEHRILRVLRSLCFFIKAKWSHWRLLMRKENHDPTYILKGLFRLLGNDFGWDMTKDRENSYTTYNVEITLMFMFSSLQNSQIHGLIDHKGWKETLKAPRPALLVSSPCPQTRRREGGGEELLSRFPITMDTEGPSLGNMWVHSPTQAVADKLNTCLSKYGEMCTQNLLQRLKSQLWSI